MKQSISLWLQKKWMHFLCWTVFITFEIVFVELLFKTSSHPLNYLIHYLIVVSVFYLNAEVTLPLALKNRTNSYWLVPLAIVVIMSIFLFWNYAADIFVVKHQLSKRTTPIVLDNDYVLRILYRCFYIMGYSCAYFYFSNFIKEKKITADFEQQKLRATIKEERMMHALSKAQNDYLKAQINPHFLFNTLDYVYHNISISSPDAAEAIVTLSEMMRYAIASNENEEFIFLGEEIEQVEKLIYLYQLRKNNELNISTYFAEEARVLKFVPLIVLTLVENIFKHGNVGSKEMPTVISVFVEAEQLVIQTENALNLTPPRPSTNTGLRNIRQRLIFAYGNEIKFDFGPVEEVFKVNIAIPLPRILLQQAQNRLLYPSIN